MKTISAFILSIIALVSGVLWAQSSCFLMNVGGGMYSMCGDAVVEPSGDPYDLGTLPSIVSDVEWPEDPTITQSVVNVSTNAHWTDADNTKYVVAAGTYTAKNLSCNHCEYELDDDAVINGALSFSGHHVKWVGGRKTGSGEVSYTGDGDFLLMNFRAYNSGGEINGFSGSDYWERIAFVNVTLESDNDIDNGAWVWYNNAEFPSSSPSTFRGCHLIFANVVFISDGQNNRIQDICNHVTIDSYYNPTVESSNGVRLHEGMEDVYYRDTIIVGGAVNFGDPQITNMIFDNVTRYDTTSIGFSNGVGVNCTNCTIDNSQYYHGGGAGGPPPLGDATGTNPNMLAWDGSTVPDHTSSRATADNGTIPYGSPH